MSNTSVPCAANFETGTNTKELYYSNWMLATQQRPHSDVLQIMQPPVDTKFNLTNAQCGGFMQNRHCSIVKVNSAFGDQK